MSLQVFWRITNKKYIYFCMHMFTHIIVCIYVLKSFFQIQEEACAIESGPSLSPSAQPQVVLRGWGRGRGPVAAAGRPDSAGS